MLGRLFDMAALPPFIHDEALPSLAAIHTLYIFDFDNTLVDTPDIFDGKQCYKKHFGRDWPFKGWVNEKASLQAPLLSRAGPALTAYRAIVGHLGVASVVLTGRIERLRPEVLAVMASFQIAPDTLICKDSAFSDTPQ